MATVHKLKAVRRLLMVALTAALVLLVSPSAFAAAVPMCGENAQSIDAPPIILPGKGHVLERVLCAERDAFELGHGPSDAPRPLSSISDDAPQRACPIRFVFARAPRTTRLGIDQQTLAPQRGFYDSIDRPPRRA